jgi:hypothetical protein
MHEDTPKAFGAGHLRVETRVLLACDFFFFEVHVLLQSAQHGGGIRHAVTLGFICMNTQCSNLAGPASLSSGLPCAKLTSTHVQKVKNAWDPGARKILVCTVARQLEKDTILKMCSVACVRYMCSNASYSGGSWELYRIGGERRESN